MSKWTAPIYTASGLCGIIRLMDKPLNFLYDHAADVLHMSAGHPVLFDSVPLNEQIILQLDPMTQQVVGFSMIDFLKRFKDNEEPVTVPVIATFARVNAKTKRRRPARKKSQRK